MSDLDARSRALLYRDVFEVSKLGALVLEDLHVRFCRIPDLSGTQEALLRTYVQAAQREVIEHIVRQINRANEAPDPDPGENNE